MPVSTTMAASGSRSSSHRRPCQALRVRQAEVEQHARRAVNQLPAVGEQPRPLNRDAGARLEKQLLDQKGITVIVFNQQNPNLLRTS